MKKFDLEFSVDPLFQKTSAAFDEGGARGLLLNHLSVHRGCEILFDSSEIVDEEANTHQETASVNLSELKDKLNLSNLPKLEICPVYVNWTFSDRPEEDLGEVELDETIAFDEMQDDNITDMDEGFDNNDIMTDFPDMNVNPEDFHNILVADTEPNQDYSFFDMKKLDELDGGSHWKFKADSKTQAKKPKKEPEYDEDGNIIEPKRKPRKKQVVIDFFGETPDGFEKLFEPAGLFLLF